MTPQKLSDWTKENLTKLLIDGVFEPDTFDFKEYRTTKKSDQEKQDIRKDCCAFANSQGGFLVIGVNDDRSKSAAQRLVGMDSSFDFFKEFGDFPSSCRPSIEWQPLNPPITFDNGRVVHVIWIPRSWKAPHCIATDKPVEGFLFPKRTNKGNEYMSYEEVRMSFLGFYEKRLKLNLLKLELEQIQEHAQNSIMPGVSNMTPVVGLSINTVETVLADSYTVIHERPQLVTDLNKLRVIIRSINSRLNIIHLQLVLPLTNRMGIIADANNALEPQYRSAIDVCATAIMELNEILK